MVQGSNDNIKLTYSEDIPLIKSILSSQGRGEDSLWELVLAMMPID